MRFVHWRGRMALLYDCTDFCTGSRPVGCTETSFLQHCLCGVIALVKYDTNRAWIQGDSNDYHAATYDHHAPPGEYIVLPGPHTRRHPLALHQPTRGANLAVTALVCCLGLPDNGHRKDRGRVPDW